MRQLLLAAVVLLIPGMLLAKDSVKQDSMQYLLIGTYTKKQSEGIYVYTFNTQSGELKQVSIAKSVDNPSYLVIAPDEKHVYSVNETGAERTGGVSAFELDHNTGQLQFMNKQAAGGEGPCYINMDGDGTHVLVGNYASGSLSVLPVQPTEKWAHPCKPYSTQVPV